MDRHEQLPTGTVESQPAPAEPSPGLGGEAGAPGSTAELARRVAAAVQDLVRQVADQDAYRRQLEQRLRAYEEHARAHESVTQALTEVANAPLTDDDLRNLQKVLQALAQDPNHIMVLASVAQHASELQAVVSSYQRLYEAVRRAAPQA